jgi:REP element-mobilizing transposase RayT
MIYNPDKHRRRSIRLKGYDYSQPGAYFVTICAHNREMLFGDIIDNAMIMNEYGEMVEYTWYDLHNHNHNIKLDDFVIMPNHVHGVIIINGIGPDAVGAGSKPAPTTMNHKQHGLSEIIRQFKTFSARHINKIRQSPGIHVWQRNYYEHIVRDENELNRIRKYIIENPLNWDMDNENPNTMETIK